MKNLSPAGKSMFLAENIGSPDDIDLIVVIERPDVA
jgi:hypothetical protein